MMRSHLADPMARVEAYEAGYYAAEGAIEAWGLILAVRSYLHDCAWREPIGPGSEAYRIGQNDAMLYAVSSREVA